MLQLRGISLDILRKFVSDTSSAPENTQIASSPESIRESLIEKPDFSSIIPRLSTMTICGNLGTSLDIALIRDTLPIQPYWSQHRGIVLAEGYNDSGAVIRRGTARRYIMKYEYTKPFLNCTTLYLRIFDEETGEAKEPSIKLFKNGGFQMTGIRTPAQATLSILTMKDLVIQHCITAVENPEILTNLTRESLHIKVCMMVSDLTIPYTIHREEVQRLISERTRLISSFESTTYQGVNIKYFWNPESPHRDGICRCAEHCRGKDSPCRRITIAPFQTGKIIITGGSLTEKELGEAAKWILDFLRDNYKQVLSPPRQDLRRKRDAFICPNPFRSGENRILKIRPERIVLNHSLHSIINNETRSVE
jgi:hypothetical protein